MRFVLLYCCWSARSLRMASFLATASLPRMRLEVGMVVTVPAAEVSTRPPAVVKAAVAPAGSSSGWAEAMETRHTARVTAIKPCNVALLTAGNANAVLLDGS